jgi:hypothetical protein
VHLKFQDVLPVVISVLVIILVAIIEKQSKLFASITASMPLTMPLALWIVYASSAGDKTVVSSFSQDLFLSLLPTVAFVITVWLAARTGMKLVPMLACGYTVWALGQGFMLLLRRWLGIG